MAPPGCLLNLTKATGKYLRISDAWLAKPGE
jgi:hypothetical protein